VSELVAALESVKNKKTPGSDGLNTEFRKCAYQKILIRFFDLISIFWVYGRVTRECVIALIATVYKKGDLILKITEV
jgi:hypothetical protein